MFTSIAIIGRPNVGKSTLFNKLTKSRQAIVSDFSGLTKDRNYGYISFGDQKSLIIDTGGIAQDNSILKEDLIDNAKKGKLYEPKSTKHSIKCNLSKEWVPVTLISSLFELRLD